MSYITMRGTGDAGVIADRLTRSMLSGAFSCELVQSMARKPAGADVRILVFDKYYMRSSNRASLTVVLSSDGQGVTADLIGAGGGNGALINFSWGAEEDFVDSAARELRSMGFR